MQHFPFVSLPQSLVILRVSLAFIFLTHAVVRVLKGTIDSFAYFLNNKGLVIGTALVWGITIFEIVGGIALALGYFTRWLSAGFILMLVIGVILIHASLGWFVGEHGTGGTEYSFILIMALVVIAAKDRKGKG